MIGKRKRDTSVVSRSIKTKDQEDTPTAVDSSYQDVFRKFFEAEFEPLEVPGGKIARAEESEEDDEDGLEDSEIGSDWDGISAEEDEVNTVEVVDHADSSANAELPLDKKARKAFMTAKLPSFSWDQTTAKRSPTKDEDGDEDKVSDANNLKNDLALQRLLQESHLLESGSDLAPTGKNRLKALDLRMQSLGAKTSLYHQQNMPSSQRRGIKAKAEKKEDKRRVEARENGIILEKQAPKTKSTQGRRERGVGGPSIGKFTGGTLNLSKQDLWKAGL
ncbi:hypothetical protein FE257_005177 [Aspergillus nanangensis]|uniref:Uncharacterized protein n=1 Tax=Aspergillus nanangensis TaxID=2582783 RepID=A0AAD4GVR3_ASPNN|nr:hypothetical protein FE257_005177 [Aspergillus nanangensis]